MSRYHTGKKMADKRQDWVWGPGLEQWGGSSKVGNSRSSPVPPSWQMDCAQESPGKVGTAH